MNASYTCWSTLKKSMKTTAILSATAWYCAKSDSNTPTDVNSWKYSRYFNTVCGNLSNTLFKSYSVNCQALTQEQRQNIMSKPTDVYVWGNGYQTAAALDYGNFYPKKIKNFSTPEDPQIIMVKFGEFNEAYLDKQGKIHICKKHRLSSQKIHEVDDHYRPDMKVLEIPGRKVMDMAFTQNRLFALTDKNEVYIWKINYRLPEGMEAHGDYMNVDTNDFIVDMETTPIQVKELKNIVEIASGTDHFLALDQDGYVWAMGDDTFGQCGQLADHRPEIPPFKERRITKPMRVRLPTTAVKIASGFRHCFAINEAGELWGWGYNNQQQLSHSEEYATETSQKRVMFEPVRISTEIDTRRVINAAGGKDFSVFVTKNRDGLQEVWATGNNLRGQLGINRISHLQDVVRLDDISGFVDSTRQEPLNIAHLSCGRRHSMLVFDYGAFFTWGDNEKGQMGDRTRRMIESPFPKAKFEIKHNVLNVEASFDNCAVVVQRLPEKIRDKDDEDEKRKKKRSKRQARPIQHAQPAIVKEEKPPTTFEKLKDKVSRLWKRRQEEIQKMKATKEQAKEKSVGANKETEESQPTANEDNKSENDK